MSITVKLKLKPNFNLVADFSRNLHYQLSSLFLEHIGIAGLPKNLITLNLMI